MITFEETDDPKFITDVFTHPSVWPWISDDACGNPEDYHPPITHGVLFVKVLHEKTPIGCLMLVGVNAVTIEQHTALLPEWRNKFTKAAFLAELEFIRDILPTVKRIRTWVPAFNRPALCAARAVGFDECGKEEKSFLHGGQLHDMHLFGVNV